MKIKKIYVILIMLLSILTLSNTLESINYDENEVALTFSEKVPEYTKYFDETIPTISFNFQNTVKNKSLIRVVHPKTEYVRTLLTDEFENATDFIMYLNKNTSYVIYTLGDKELRIRFKEKEIKQTIVLDAGHGGKDSGAIGDKGYYEKDLALATVLALRDELKDKYNVVLTRETDVFIPLDKRAEIGNEANAALFVSVHLNASRRLAAEGSEVFYYSKNPSAYARQVANYENSFDIKGARKIEAREFVINDVLYGRNQFDSAIVAQDVLTNIIKSMGTVRRRVTGANFAVLRGSDSPSILIELGFITNRNDRIKFDNKEGQKKAAKAIADAIKKHF